jgi:multicomponent Na+:H+ antiporter subunit B
MIVPLDVILFLILIVTAVLALMVEDLLAAVALLAGYSLFAAILFAEVNAIDVALVEAALGAGLTGVLFIAAILATSRRSEPRPDPRRRWVVIPLIAAFAALVFYASFGLPDRGDPDAPAQQGVSQVYLADSLADTQTPNVVTSLLADYRSLDTLGETMVIVTAALSASLVLLRRVDDPGKPTAQEPAPIDGPPDDDRASTDPDAGEAPNDGSPDHDRASMVSVDERAAGDTSAQEADAAGSDTPSDLQDGEVDDR